jgi:hypothetical protein
MQRHALDIENDSFHGNQTNYNMNNKKLGLSWMKTIANIEIIGLFRRHQNIQHSYKPLPERCDKWLFK